MSGESKADQSSAAVSALSGITGASIAKLFVHPIDTLKAKIQIKSKTDLASKLQKHGS